MSKRHLPKKTVSAIGDARIAVLTSLSLDAVKAGKGDRARRYVQLARSIGMKTRTGIPRDFRYCKGCLLPMVPGVNCTVRLTGGKMVSGCECGRIWRMPYNKERSG
ncbi:MAG: ribonuclease P protein component 4 [Candidatus Methanoplasma sp.]|jgi:ribonuclease P protein subunit RPR2|nr:ribonuclease P protein component 4 [Candidatus Methanoplasma sp.]